MNKERIKKEIDVLTTKRSNSVSILIVLFGGIIGISINLRNIFGFVLIIFGIAIAILFAKGLFEIESRIDSLLKELDKNV